MATLRKLKPGVWQVSWKNPITGKRERPSFHNKNQAKKIFDEYLTVEKYSKSGFSSQAIASITGSYNDYTLETIWDWFLNNRAKNLNKETVYHYKRSISSFMDVYGEDTLVSGLRSYKWKNYMGLNVYKEKMSETLSQTSINTYISKVSTIFAAAVEDGLIDINPIIIKKDKIKRITDAKPIKQWTHKEIKTIMDHRDVTKYEKLIFMFVALSGVRKSEICGKHVKELENGQKFDCGFYWEHVLWDQNAILIFQKAEYQNPTLRQVSPNAMAILRILKYKYGDFAPIPFGETHLRNLVKRVAKKTGVSFTVHDIRRLTGQVVIDVTGDLSKAQEMYGHSDISVTRQSYADYNTDQKAEVANQIGKELEKYLPEMAINDTD